MKKLLKSAFFLSLMAVMVFGITLVATPTAEAGGPCPPCYVPTGASGWAQYGSCIGGPSHCPLYYRTYRNVYSGQICRAQIAVAPI